MRNVFCVFLISMLVLWVGLWMRSHWVEDIFVWHLRDGGFCDLQLSAGAVYVRWGSRSVDRHYGYGYVSHWSFEDPTPWEENYGIGPGRWRGIHVFSVRTAFASSDPSEEVVVVSCWLIACMILVVTAAICRQKIRAAIWWLHRKTLKR